ncbi:MAG: hypothetical protein HYZ28_08715 [Myxococcales bacterium]|nr:hypothetical protein [Myxococcales bacterium]
MRPWAIVLLPWLAACGGRAPCSSDCPDISGVYAVNTVAVSGRCEFPPYQVGPSLTLVQSDAGRRVAAQVIDPVNLLDVALVGDVFAPRPGDAAGLVGFFSAQAQVGRLNDPGLTIDVRLTGSVREQAGRKSLAATLSTLGTRAGANVCATDTTLSGEGPGI